MTPAAGHGLDRAGWLLLAPEAVPERWRDRSVPMMLVPLLPGEASSLLAGEPVLPVVSKDDETLLRMAARGASAGAIARRLHVGPRTVQRRLARYRKDLGVTTHAELRAELAKRGF